MKFKELGNCSPDQLSVSPNNNRTMIPPDDALQPMCDSIKIKGVIDPIVINPQYEIVSGQLRWTCAKILGLPTVPFLMYEFESPFEERMISLMQDTHRHNLTDVDRSNFIRGMREAKISPDEAAYQLGVSTKTIYRWAEATKMPSSAKYSDDTLATYEKMDKEQKKMAKALERTAPFKSDPVGVINAVNELPKNDIKQAIKDAKQGMPVDINARIAQKKRDDVEQVGVTISIATFKKLKEIAIREKKDIQFLLTKFVEEGVTKYSLT